MLVQFLTRYQLEGIALPDALEDFTRQAIDNLLKELPPERLLKQVPVADRFKGLTADQVLAALPHEVRLVRCPD